MIFSLLNTHFTWNGVRSQGAIEKCSLPEKNRLYHNSMHYNEGPTLPPNYPEGKNGKCVKRMRPCVWSNFQFCHIEQTFKYIIVHRDLCLCVWWIFVPFTITIIIFMSLFRREASEVLHPVAIVNCNKRFNLWIYQNVFMNHWWWWKDNKRQLCRNLISGDSIVFVIISLRWVAYQVNSGVSPLNYFKSNIVIETKQ